MQLLDVILVVLMLVSGLLALMRGFTREILSLFAWVVAGAAAWWAVQIPPLIEFTQQFIAQQKLAVIVTGAAAFLLVLLIMSVISVKIGDWVLDSAVGPFDRTLGGFYGVARGLVLVTIAYLFYIYNAPVEKRFDWIEKARLKPLVVGTAEVLIGFMPQDIGEVLARKLAAAPDAEEDAAFIGKGDKRRLDNLIGTPDNGR